MNHAATTKYVNILDPVSGTGAVTVDNHVDTVGYDYLTIVVSTGSAAAVSALTAIESDASDMSSPATVATVGTSLDIDGGTSTLHTSGNDEIVVINIDLVGRKRYLSITMTRGGTTLTSVLGILSKPAEATTTLADRNVLSMIDV